MRANTADWRGAAASWQQAAKSLDPKVAGRAFFNLAVASEARGNLTEAVAWTRKAAHTTENRAARAYLAGAARPAAGQSAHCRAAAQRANQQVAGK